MRETFGKRGSLGVTLLALIAVGASMPGDGRAADVPRQTALTAARFSITIDGYEIASFTELQGLDSSVDFIPSEEPGAATSEGEIILRRPLSSSLALWDWQSEVRTGGLAARKDTTIVVYDSAGNPVANYRLTNAWPKKIEVGSLKAGSTEVQMETITIVSGRIQRLRV